VSEPPAVRAVAHIDALPLVRPFIAPEEIERRHGFASLLRLGANESAFGAAPAVLAAMRAEAARSSLYGDPESFDLRQKLADLHRCEPENIVVGAGIDDLMGLAVRAYCAEGGVAVATAGTYPTFAYHVDGYGGRLAGVPYREDFTVDPDGLAEAARRLAARVVYLSNPDNPGGRELARGEVEALAGALPDPCVFLLDEAYAEFGSDPEPVRTIDPRTIRLRTFSKAYGLAGARIGYAIAPLAIAGTFNKIRLQYGVNRIAQAGALAALEETGFLAQVVRETARGREAYAGLGARLGLPVAPSSTNFVLFDAGSRERAERLLRELERLAVFVRKPGAAPIDRCIRVTVGTEAERGAFGAALTAALERIA
jgi:histidinol-phosphate aminotransferase